MISRSSNRKRKLKLKRKLKNQKILTKNWKCTKLIYFRVIFSLTVDKEQTVPFRYIQESLLKNHNIYSPYVRFNKTEGNFTIDIKVWTP